MSAFGSITSEPICLFHGGRLTGPVEVRTRSGSMAHGPGLYLTTSYWTARKYAKGGGFVARVCIEPDVRWAHQVRVPVAKALEFADSIPKLKRRADVKEDLETLASRRPDGTVSFVGVTNIMQANGSYGASVAQDVVEALVRFGVDATLVLSADSGEDWVVVHNAEKIRSITRLNDEAEDLPRLEAWG